MSPLRFVLFSVCLSALAAAQESPTPPPSVRIEFAPPPMEGTISLGIYDANGKLVRVLHREAPLSDFKVGVNGLITSWDGKDGAGAQAPAGKYSSRGFMMGEPSVEGEAFLFNDWVSEDSSLRPARIRDLRAEADGGLVFAADSNEGKVLFGCDLAGKILSINPLPENYAMNPWATVALAFLENGSLFVRDKSASRRVTLSGSSQALDLSSGSDGNLWLIVRDGGNVEVREYTPAGEFIRRLAIKPDEPAPVKISASGPANEIFLLEQNDKEQRVRGLALAAAQPPLSPGAPAISTWKVIFSKSILFNDSFARVRDLLKGADGKPFVPQEKVKLTLVPNPLNAGQSESLEAGIAVDKQGSFLQLPDGLPLCHLTETPGLRWAVMGSDGQALTIFQSDGAVVEEFKASHLENMMSFDCGSFDYAPAKN